MRTYAMSGRLTAMVLAIILLLCIGRPAFAARFVKFEVSIDGKVVLQTSKGDTGRENADTVWRYLTQLELRPIDELKVEVNLVNPRQATLHGKIVIEARYGGRAEVQKLKLVRDNENSRWKIAPEDVEYTFKIRAPPK